MNPVFVFSLHGVVGEDLDTHGLAAHREDACLVLATQSVKQGQEVLGLEAQHLTVLGRIGGQVHGGVRPQGLRAVDSGHIGGCVV